MNRTQAARTAATRGDRAAAVIRPVSPADEAVLRDFFATLSVESRYLRFFAPVTPSCGLLDLMAGKPAHVDAIIAVAGGVIVGHAMAADRPASGDAASGDTASGDPGTSGGGGEPRATDIGVVVADAWQRRGVGATLVRALIERAQARGVTALAMDVLPGNRRVLAMITGHWPQAAIAHAADRVDVRVPLPPLPAPRPHAVRPAIWPGARRGLPPAAAAAGKALAAAGR